MCSAIFGSVHAVFKRAGGPGYVEYTGSRTRVLATVCRTLQADHCIRKDPYAPESSASGTFCTAEPVVDPGIAMSPEIKNRRVESRDYT